MDETFMRAAISMAAQAESAGEVPVGAVVVLNNQIIAQAGNRSIQDKDPSAHAEVIALRKAGQILDNYRLLNTTLYVTLEPCAMCVGAMHHARITRLVTGAHDPKSGCSHTVQKLLNSNVFHHRIELETGVLADECSQQLKQFFKKRR